MGVSSKGMPFYLNRCALRRPTHTFTKALGLDPAASVHYSQAMRVFAVLVVSVLGSMFGALFGCGSGPVHRTVTPMTPEAELAFENGIDFIDDPTLLEGNWLEDWEQDIARRVELCDAVLVVRVISVHENVDLDRDLSYRLASHIETVRYGTGFQDEITLVSRTSDDGHPSVRENQARLLQQQFVAFVRFVEGEDGQVVPRWHLSPAADRVVRRVNSLLATRVPGDRRRVIVRDSRDPSVSAGGDDEEE
jgi:hypothetical protein